MATVNTISGGWCCCDELFDDFMRTIEHINRHHIMYMIKIGTIDTALKHINQEKFKCRVCNYATNYYTDMLEHVVCQHTNFHITSPTGIKRYCLIAKPSEQDYGKKGIQTKNGLCSLCETEHKLENCNKFLQFTAQQKTMISRAYGLCYKCLDRHKKGQCKSENCENCHKPHHKLLCYKVKPNNHK